MPVKIVIVDVIPIKMPEKFGVLSTMLARAPVVTAPWNERESVRNKTACVTLQPAYARPKQTIPFRMRSEIF